MIYSGGPLEAEIPPIDLVSFTFERKEELGDKPALIDGPSGRTMGYAELHRSVRSLAAGLARRGFNRGETFAIFMPNAPEYAIAFFGSIAAGARCTTINPLYTHRELAFQLTDSRARALLTVPACIEVARQAARTAGCELFVVGEGDGATPLAELLGDPDAAPRIRIDAASDVAVLPYSSGTTGLSKGVMLSHRNLIANELQMDASSLRVSRDDVVIAVLPFFHLYGMAAIMGLGLRSGATLVTMPRFELGQYLELSERYRATRAYLVPPIALALATAPAVDAYDLSSLRMIICGAAPLGAELEESCARRIGCPVIQAYGMTELSPATHAAQLDVTPNRGSVGRTLVGTDARLVDPGTGQDVDPGERGELWVRGPQVMLGYLNNPAATEAMIDRDGWLHTGDVATADREGWFYIVDRLKELIKYKGFQVAPAELEAILITHPQVSDCAVIGVPDEEAGELPKAFVVPASDAIDPGQVLEFVAAQVAPHKRIRSIELIDGIPKSSSGKILRRLLRDRAPVA